MRMKSYIQEITEASKKPMMTAIRTSPTVLRSRRAKDTKATKVTKVTKATKVTKVTKVTKATKGTKVFNQRIPLLVI